MEKEAEKYLIDIDSYLFQDENVRKEFVKLVVKQYHLEKELNQINRKINTLKYGT